MKLESQLSQLEAAEIVRRASDPDLSYLFKHALTQETAYASLLKKARRDIHLQVAQTIEAQFADRLDEYAELLARHYAAGENDVKTFEYATRAGDANARIFANAEAIAHYSIGIEAVKRNPALILPRHAEEGTLLRDLYLKRGRALELLGKYDEALASYVDMGTLASTLNDGALELGSLVARATLYSTHTPLYDADRALEFSARALALARTIGERLTEAKILWTQMLRHIYGSGDAAAGVECGQASLAILRELNPQPGSAHARLVREQLAYSLNDLLYAYIQIGKLERGLAARLEARDLWRELDNKPMLADNLAGVALAQWSFGDAQTAIATADEGYAIAESVSNPWSMAQGRTMRGYAMAELGRFAEAFAALSEGDEFATVAETGGAMIASRCGLASNYLTVGMIEGGLKHAQRALEGAQKYLVDWHLWPQADLIRLHLALGDVASAQRIADESGIESPERKLFKAFMPGVAEVVLADGELALAKRDYARVLAIVDEALDYFNGSCPNFLPDLYLVRADAMLGQGKPDEAARALRDAVAATDKARRVRWKVLGTASQVERARGNGREADHLREKARAEMQFITTNLNEEMRETFLALPIVRQISSGAG